MYGDTYCSNNMKLIRKNPDRPLMSVGVNGNGKRTPWLRAAVMVLTKSYRFSQSACRSLRLMSFQDWSKVAHFPFITFYICNKVKGVKCYGQPKKMLK